METTEDPIRDDATVEKLKADLRRVVEDVEGLLRVTAGQMGDKVGEARARAEETLQSARARLTELEGQARERASEAAGEADRYVRDNPWQAVGIAAGVAFLLGIIVSRR
jgi:ElaB/YqjD/DUF883 family membrane-anchored ribosome-binding protein